MLAIFMKARVSSGGLPEQYKAGDGAIGNHADGIDFHELGTHERGDEEKAAHAELPRVFAWCGEVVGRHQHQCGGGQQSHHGGAQTLEDAFHRVCLHVFHEHLADENHQNKRRQHQREGGGEGAEHGHRRAVAGVENGGVAAVGGRVDAHGAGRHLADGHDVGELCRGHPVPVVHHLALNKREHAVAAAKSEQPDFKKGDEEIEENHFDAPSVGSVSRP